MSVSVSEWESESVSQSVTAMHANISNHSPTHTHTQTFLHTHRLAVDAVLRLKGSGNLDYIQVIALTEASDPMLFHVLLVLISRLPLLLLHALLPHMHTHTHTPLTLSPSPFLPFSFPLSP